MQPVLLKTRDISKTRVKHICSGCGRCIQAGESCNEQCVIYDYRKYSVYECDVCIAFGKHIGAHEYNEYVTDEMTLADHPEYLEFAASFAITKMLTE
jgi:hypothetical protein